jgi:hypothetical protein
MPKKLDSIKESSEISSYWESHLKNWEKSGIKQSEYCRSNNLNYSMFHYWKRKLYKSLILGSSAKLVQINNTLVSENNSLEKSPTFGLCTRRPSLRLWVGRDYCIDVDEDFSVAVLNRLLQSLRRI